MAVFNARVSQVVFYDVEIEAPDEQAARDLAHAAIHDPSPAVKGLDEYDMTEVDSSELELV